MIRQWTKINTGQPLRLPLMFYWLLYTAFLFLFEFIYKIIELICINIWIMQNSAVYLYYQRNTNTLLINKLNSNIMTNSTVTIQNVTFNKVQNVNKRQTAVIDETYFRPASTNMKNENSDIVGTLLFETKKGRLYNAFLFTWGVGQLFR